MEKFENQNQEKPITIKDLIRDQSAIRQSDVLARADKLFPDKAGRYYGGALTEEEIDILDPEYKKRNES